MKQSDKMNNFLHQTMQKFEKAIKNPTDYLKEQVELSNNNLVILKSLYDYSKTSGSHYQSKNLPDELFVKQMDEEQIWQQLEMQNESFWEKCMTETCRLLSLNVTKLNLIESHSIHNDDSESDNSIEKSCDNESDDVETDNAETDDVESVGELVEDDKSQEIEDVEKTNSNNIASAVDDPFFKLHEMEAFLDSEDKKEMNKLNGRIDDSNEINYFESLSESEPEEMDGEQNISSKNLMFADFFDTQDTVSELTKQTKEKRRAEREAKNILKEKQLQEDLGLESECDEESDEGDRLENDEFNKSEFDMRQDRLKKRIEDYEEKSLAEKPWQLKGEITSSTRPKNSLLEEVLEFDSVARPPPLITEETTLCLEDIIKRRIKSKSYDDVVRKIKPMNEHQDFRKSLVLQQEKSKESLAQIYEKEYLEKVHKLNNVDADTTESEIPAHAEIRKAMKDLFVKLDALSNFHFTSKPIAAEAKIISNIPAIEMEEVAPLAVSHATLLAPEEVRTRSTGDEIGKTERTITDKKRERRKKKLKQKLIKKQNDLRVEQKEKLGIKATSKEKQMQLMNQVTKGRYVTKGKISSYADTKALKSSKSFFSELQDNAILKGKTSNKKNRANDLQANESAAKRFKL